MKTWWNNLSLREQQIVAVGVTVVAAVIFYLTIWSAYLNRIDLMRKQIRTEQTTLAWMQAADRKIKKIETQTKNQNTSMTPVELMSLLQKQFKESGLEASLVDLKQAGSDTVELHFQKAPFDELIRIMESVIKEQNVTITQFSAAAQNVPGTVNADVMLKLKI